MPVTSSTEMAAGTIPDTLPSLVGGECLDQPTFHTLYEAMPEDFRAELIGGVVHLIMPLSLDHGDVHAPVIGWLYYFEAASKGVKTSDNLTLILDNYNEPQPDACLRVLPEFGGRTEKKGRYLSGPPELLVEVAVSSKSFGLRQKKTAYQAAGVEEYLVLLVEDRKALWHHLQEGQYVIIEPGSDGILRSIRFPGLWLNVEALMEGNSARVLEVVQEGIASIEHQAWVQEMTGLRRS